ncbi:TniQ family protein [Aliidiomarina indica]|uniref:TniQ family protein n=1 Tax=Aliidiomarina indica TaxID=2749147 RepID=UPI0018902260|nr:TniQ family protein [Aliidiomarina indica]
MNNDSLVTMMFDNVLLQKEEYFPSYVYRLMQFANFMGANHFLDLLKISSSRQIGETLPRWAVSLVTQNYGNHRVSEVVDNNLLGCFWRSFIEDDEVTRFLNQQTGKRATGRVLFNAEKVFLPFQSIKLCPECFNTSVEAYGVGVWNAQHQAATSFICHKHQQILLQRPVSQFNGFEFSQSFFDKDAYVAPSITLFHRWLDFETNRIYQLGVEAHREEVKLHRNVFMESSFYSHKRCAKGVYLDKKWRRALSKYLTILFPHMKNEAEKISSNAALHASNIMSVKSSVHPLLYLLFKFFYLYDFKP